MNPRFWRLLASGWPLCLPRRRLAEEIGDEAVDEGLRHGLLVKVPMPSEGNYPCRANAAPACAMEVVHDGWGRRAICHLAPAQCHDEPIAPEDAWLIRVEPRAFARRIADALGTGTPGFPDRLGDPVRLGEVRFGTEPVLALFAPRPRATLDAIARLLEEAAHRVAVVIVADGTAVPQGAPRRVNTVKVDWVALGDVARFDQRFALDLSEFVVRHRFHGVDLGALLKPGCDLVLDPEAGAYLWGGKPLDLARCPVAVKLLHLLAEGVGTYVMKREVYVRLWPDEVKARSREPFEPERLQRRFRQIKSDLAALFASHPAEGLPANPIEQQWGPEGGIRLNLDAARVRWLSRPEDDDDR